MSPKRLKMAGSESSRIIRRAARHLRLMTDSQKIDLMVKAKVMTPDQAERAKKKWAELQAADRTEGNGQDSGTGEEVN